MAMGRDAREPREMHALMAHIEGPHLALRLVRPEDAGYIHGLRTDPRYSAHLSAVKGSAEDQLAWIEGYTAREARGLEYYYVITRRHDGRPCGTVRLYGLADDCFTWGSWILDGNKPPKAALESAMLVCTLGFDRLGLRRSVCEVLQGNERALAFHRRFGASESAHDGERIHFHYTARQFTADRERFLSSLVSSTRPFGAVRRDPE